MATLAKYAVTRSEVESALEQDGMALGDYESTIFGLIWDGVEWTCYEDSLDETMALEWAQRAEGYGEHVGLYVWNGGE